MTKPQKPPLLGRLTALEQQVIDAARRGEWIHPEIVMPVDELTTTDEPSLRLRADLLRELLMGRRGELDPRGLRIRGVRVVGEVDLDHITAVTGLYLARCALPDGMRCVRARLRDVSLHGSQLQRLDAGSLRTDGDLILSRVFVNGRGARGAVWLSGAHIGGQLNLREAEITNDTGGPALLADGLRTDERLTLEDATLRGTGESGAVRLLSADIGGQLDLDRAEITNDTGPALHADGLRTHNNMYLRDTTLRGTDEVGAVWLSSAQIGGQLDLDRAEITNDTGPALHADGLRTDEHLTLEAATLRGTGESGAVRLLSADIGGQLDLDRAEITNDTGPALLTDGLRTDGNLILEDATLLGASEFGALLLSGAHIEGQMILIGTQVNNELGRLMALSETEVTAAFVMPASVVCPHAREDVGRRECPDGDRQINVVRLTFPILSEVSWRQWLHLLRHHTSIYWPQPYQQLAAVERAAGHDNNARQILIAQQEDLRHRTPEALGGRLAQTRHRLWGWLGRYGYRAHRLVIALALTLVIAASLSYAAGQVITRPGHHAAERIASSTAPVNRPGTRCSTAELIGVGIDRGLPLGATGLRARCDLDTGTRWGQAFTYAIWGLQAVVWALATLAIAAYTGLVRKTA